MDNPMHEKELIVDLVLIRNLIDAVPQFSSDILELWSVSLVRFPSRNLLLLTWYGEDFFTSKLYVRFAEIAKFVHQEHGKTHICLRYHKKDIVIRWDSENFFLPLKTSIHPSEWLL